MIHSLKCKQWKLEAGRTPQIACQHRGHRVTHTEPVGWREQHVTHHRCVYAVDQPAETIHPSSQLPLGTPSELATLRPVVQPRMRDICTQHPGGHCQQHSAREYWIDERECIADHHVAVTPACAGAI